MLSLLTTLLLSAAPPDLAVLATQPMGDTTELRFQRLGATELSAVAARFTHIEGSTVLGAVLPGTRVVLATAQATKQRDASYASGLYRLEAGKPSKLLVDRVAVSTRPVILPEGRVFVQRGTAGLPPTTRGERRLDTLSLDEVNPSTGETRTLLSTRADLLFLAGALGRELVVYRVDDAGARLEALHVDTLGVRLLGAIPDTAHDLVVDAAHQRVLFTAADAPTGHWRVLSLDLASQTLSTLAEGPSMALLPTLLPDGAVAFAPSEGGGLVRASNGARVLAPQGPGYERVRALVNGVAVGVHEVPSALPHLFAVRLADGAVLPLAAPKDVRLDVAGVLP